MDIGEKYEKLLVDFNNLQIEYDKIVKLKEELQAHLKKYTAPPRSKKYYQEHKEEIKQKVKEYNKKTNYKPEVSKEKKKEYNKRWYEKKKTLLDNNCV